MSAARAKKKPQEEFNLFDALKMLEKEKGIPVDYMIEKIQTSLVNTIPLWKSQMVLALGLEHSRQATAAQTAVTNMTNDLLRQNAEMLRMGTTETAKEAERSIVDIETLQHTNEQLIATLDEVMQIQKEGREKRAAAEAELGKIEGELKKKLLELH